MVSGKAAARGTGNNPNIFGSYPAGVTPNSTLASVGFEDLSGTTFLEALSAGGGGLNALGRIIAGAYLNAATVPDFPFTPAQVIDDFNAVFPGGDYNALKAKYEALQDPCPFDRNPGTEDPKDKQDPKIKKISRL